MADGYPRYNQDASRLLDVRDHPEAFGFATPMELRRAGWQDPKLAPIAPLAIFGSFSTWRGLTDEMFINEQALGTARSQLDNPVFEGWMNLALRDATDLRGTVTHALGEFRERAIARCRNENYRVLAGVKLGLLEGQPTLYHFHAKPLELTVLDVREKFEAEILDGLPVEELHGLSIRNPSAYTYRMVGTMMGSLMLPPTLGAPIDSL